MYTSNKHSYINACAVSDHVIAHGLRPVSLYCTPGIAEPIKTLERARFGPITEVESAKAVVERRYVGKIHVVTV